MPPETLRLQKSPRNNDNYIRTFSGVKYWPLDPSQFDVNLIDVAHALAHQCRFTGHTKFHYSVAQHAVYCALKAYSVGTGDASAMRQLALAALHHDDSEAYLSDISSPVKHEPQMEGYKVVEAWNETAIDLRFGLNMAKYGPLVKQIDRRMLRTEQSQLMTGSDLRGEVPYSFKIRKWSPWFAKFMYLYLHFRLMPGRYGPMGAAWKAYRLSMWRPTKGID